MGSEGETKESWLHYLCIGEVHHIQDDVLSGDVSLVCEFRVALRPENVAVNRKKYLHECWERIQLRTVFRTISPLIKMVAR